MKSIYLFIYIILFALSGNCGVFEEGDWVTYKDSRFVYAIDKGWNHIYFGTSGGILRYDYYRSEWDEPLTIADLPGEYANIDTVYALVFDNNSGLLWCGTSDGFFSYYTNSRTWTRHKLPLENQIIVSLAISGDKIYAYGGVNPQGGTRAYFRSSNTFGTFSYIEPSQVPENLNWKGEKEILPEQFPVLNVKSYPGMIYTRQGQLKDTWFNIYNTQCMFNDGRGYIWIGFAGYGTGQADENSRKLYLRVEGPENNIVNTIVIDNKSLWTGGKELTRWNQVNDEWIHYRPRENVDFSSGTINEILVYNDLVYSASDLGLSILDTRSGRFRTYERLDNLWDSEVTALASDGNTLWIGTTQGLNYLDFSDNVIVRSVGVEDRRILDIEADTPFVWFGSEYGLHVHDKETGEWTYVEGSPEMKESAVWHIDANSREVWVARTEGIEKFDKTKGEWTGYLSNLYGNNRAISILAQGDNVWIGTTGGLVKFDRLNNRWVRFTVEDGLPHNSVEAIEIEGDYLWLGTPKGLCKFYWNDPSRLD